MKNILIISHTYIVPINRIKWQRLVACFNDVSLTMVVPRRWPTHIFTHEARIAAIEQHERLKIVVLEVVNAGNEIAYGYYPDDLARVIIACNPDVIQVEQGDRAFSYFQVIVLTKLLGLKAKLCFFTWVNWRSADSLKHRCSWRLLGRLNRWFSDGVITGNHDAQRILHDDGFLKKSVVIPQLGIDRLFGGLQADVTKGKMIGFAGRFVCEKGIMLLLDAFTQLADLYPDWQVLLVGDGPMKASVMAYVQKHNLEHRVIIRPPVVHHQIAHLLRVCEIFVLPSYDTPSWREQFGHVLIEAMACGVPIVASDAGEIPYVVGDAGLLFAQNRVDALIEALSRMMQSPKLRKEYAERGYQRMLDNYTHEIIAAKTYQFWQDLGVIE